MPITKLPPMEHTFTISVKGTDTGKVFDGTFTYKRPNIRVNSEISKTKALLDGGMANIDKATQDFHEILATLRHTLSESPEWWEKSDYGFELYDYNVVLDIYKETQEFEKKYREEVYAEEKPEKSSKKAVKPETKVG